MGDRLWVYHRSTCNQPLRPTQPPTLSEAGDEYQQWQYSAAGQVTVGLVSHWPCITDYGISTFGLSGLRG